jgi:chromosome transmission fidelity protein 4
MTKVLLLRDQLDSIKHLSFDQSGTILAASSKNGTVYFYSISSEEPRLLKALDGLIKPLDTNEESSSKILWHPTASAFAAATNTRDFQVMSRDDWSPQKSFQDGHGSDITAAAWSPNGALLVTADKNRKLNLWEAKTQTILRKYDDASSTILSIQFHPEDNTLAYTTNEGTVYIHNNFLSSEHASYLSKPLQKPPMLQSRELMSPPPGGQTNGQTNGHRRRASRDSLSDILDLDGEGAGEDDDGFVIDDDGAGYLEAPNLNGKRSHAQVNGLTHSFKRQRPEGSFKPVLHEAFQPGSTPWRGNRRYLCLNLLGVVWTANQDTHHSVTVEFYDRSFQRDFHFTDPFLYNKACLAVHGTLFASDPRGGDPALVYYRPHETWTTRSDWRTQLPDGESITAIALSEECVVVSTSTGYVRVYSLFGLPLRVYRQKAAPAVTCAAWRNYVLTIGNGPVGADGRTSLLYSIENVARDTTIQDNDTLALAPGATLQNVFFSDLGDPCMYDSTGTLLVCQGWREQGQAKWVPLLDTKLLDRSGKVETYWPVAVADSKFHCFILKGEDIHPYFPRPLLTDFDFRMPLSSSISGTSTTADLEHSFTLSTVLSSLLRSTLAHTRATPDQDVELARLQAEADKALLRLLDEECKIGEERGLRALEICRLMPNGSGKVLELARRVAIRHGREVLADKIVRLEERRLLEAEGMEVDVEDGEF